jgi:iron complex transport system substrate-binding protein
MKINSLGILFGALAITVATTLMSTSQAYSQTESWTREFVNSDGSKTKIPKKPQRILSTSVTVTGTLLSMNAPVISSGSAANGKFFAQWADIAKERKVENVWPAGAVDIEAVYAARPDLIIVSASGAGSAKDQVSAFRQIAPTILVDDGAESWQDLATELAKAAGMENATASVIDEFDAYVAAARDKLAIPAGKVNIISFNGPGQPNPIARIGGPHASLLEALGMSIEDPTTAWHTQANQRADFVWAPYENLVDLTAQTTFLLRVDDSKAGAFLTDPVLQNVPSVKLRQVYGLGANSFRIDYYSSREIVDGMLKKFGK